MRAMSKPSGKTIHVSMETHRRLSQRGHFGDSFNDIILRLLEENERLTQEALRELLNENEQAEQEVEG